MLETTSRLAVLLCVVRSTVKGGIARVTFLARDGKMVLLHGFCKPIGHVADCTALPWPAGYFCQTVDIPDGRGWSTSSRRLGCAPAARASP